MKSYYRGVDGVFLVYDTTNLNSLCSLHGWLEDLQEVSIQHIFNDN